ncbi:hypothetical protein BGZ96_003623 [Linnemannia gamsii]|uniref:Uncharacterized protein n=1 Tax=Linnemannia gamsii TaxID=64522 RepID=A0ABQ7KFR4_9FUNG|nr:hypothetical protein BGZ96_003623 [Linnemannia gamsii]
MIQGVYLEPVSTNSDVFKEFSLRFGNKLSTLYEVNFTELVNGYLGDATEWEATTTTELRIVDVLNSTSRAIITSRSVSRAGARVPTVIPKGL